MIGDILQGRAPRDYADGGPVTGGTYLEPPPNSLLQTPSTSAGDVPYPQYTDWYQRMYGPFATTGNDALPADGPSSLGLPPWLRAALGLTEDFQPGGVGSTASGGGAGTSGPSQGVNSTSNAGGAAQVGVNAIGAIASMAGMPGIGLMSMAPAIANMVGAVSSVNQPGIATVDEAVPGISVVDAIGNIAAQTSAAAAAGIANSSSNSTGMQAETAISSDNPSVDAGPGPPGTTAEGVGNATGPDSGTWARGGLAHMRKPRGYADGGAVGRRGIMGLFGKGLAGAAASKVAPGAFEKPAAKAVRRKGDWVDFDTVPEDVLRSWWKERRAQEDINPFAMWEDPKELEEMGADLRFWDQLNRNDLPLNQLRRIAKDLYYSDVPRDMRAVQLADEHRIREWDGATELADKERSKELLDWFGDHRTARPKGWTEPLMEQDSPLAGWAHHRDEFDLPNPYGIRLGTAEERAFLKKAELARREDYAKAERETRHAKYAAQDYAYRLDEEKKAARAAAKASQSQILGPRAFESASEFERAAGLNRLSRRIPEEVRSGGDWIENAELKELRQRFEDKIEGAGSMRSGKLNQLAINDHLKGYGLRHREGYMPDAASALVYRPADAPQLQYGPASAGYTAQTAKQMGAQFDPAIRQADPMYGRDILDFLKRLPPPPTKQAPAPDFDSAIELLKNLGPKEKLPPENFSHGGPVQVPDHLARRKSSHRPIIRRAGLGYVT